jgi:hypothetical protein
MEGWLHALTIVDYMDGSAAEARSDIFLRLLLLLLLISQ